MTDAPYLYEIQFDVRNDARREYDEWVETDFLEWVNHDAVAAFDVFHIEEGLSPGIKFVFSFTSLQEWEAFVNSDEHGNALDKLKAVTDEFGTTLWKREGVSLTGTTTNQSEDI